MHLPPQILVFLLAMLPIVEINGSIPLALTVYKLPLWQAFAFPMAGNISAGLLLIFLLDPVTTLIRKYWAFADYWISRLFEYTRKRHSSSVSQLGHFALFAFIALPGPGSGAWSAALLIHVFGIPKNASIPLMIAGLLVAGIFLAFGTEGAVNIWELLKH